MSDERFKKLAGRAVEQLMVDTGFSRDQQGFADLVGRDRTHISRNKNRGTISLADFLEYMEKTGRDDFLLELRRWSQDLQLQDKRKK